MAGGVSQAALDRMANDMHVELQGHKVLMVSLWPGLVQTEPLGARKQVRFHVKRGRNVGKTPGFGRF